MPWSRSALLTTTVDGRGYYGGPMSVATGCYPMRLELAPTFTTRSACPFAGGWQPTASARCAFKFPYMEIRRRSPDQPAVLEQTWRSMIGQVTAEGRKLVVGGRSMGGRIASQVLAQDNCAAALALFAYPLHSPGKPGVAARQASLLDQ